MVVLDAARTARITQQARELHAGRLLLQLVAGILYAIGWTAAAVCGGVWLVLAWILTAIRIGWSDARPARAGSDRR